MFLTWDRLLRNSQLCSLNTNTGVETLPQALALENKHFQHTDHVLCMNLVTETPTLMREHKQGENKAL